MWKDEQQTSSKTSSKLQTQTNLVVTYTKTEHKTESLFLTGTYHISVEEAAGGGRRYIYTYNINNQRTQEV